MMYRFVLPALLLVSGTAALSGDQGYRQRQAAKDQLALDRALAGLVPGTPKQCIDQRRFFDTQRVGDTILYKYSRREIYRTDTSGGCFGMRSGDAIVTRTTTGSICRGDIVRTIDLASRVPSGSCVFGAFIPYKRP